MKPITILGGHAIVRVISLIFRHNPFVLLTLRGEVKVRFRWFGIDGSCWGLETTIFILAENHCVR